MKKLISNVFSRISEVKEKIPARFRQLVFSVGIVFLGILAMFVLIKFKRAPETVEPELLAPLVKVETIKVRDIAMIVSGFGTVRPKVEVEIVPQVSGKVVSINPNFKAGGFIRADENLLQIDPRDYELVVQQADAVVAEAQVKLDMEKAEAEVVKKEWQQLYPGTEPDSPLVLRQPQIRQAQARLKSAKASFLTAELNLERTNLTLPIDVRIDTESVDLGQYVTVGRVVGRAYGTEAVEIELPLEDDELAWFDIPGEPVSINGSSNPGKSTTAVVKAAFAGNEHKWTGRVVRTTGKVDIESRLISVVVEVDNPFDRNDSRPPLLPGVFVDVQILGSVLKDAFAIPRDAIHNGNEVWIVKDGRLHIQLLKILRADEKLAYVTDGLYDGAQIVISSVDVVTEGMKVRTRNLAEAE